MSAELIMHADENDTDALLQEFFRTFDFYSDDDRKKISAAWELLCSKSCEIKRKCGKPYYLHPMRIAYILAQNKMDTDSICAGLLHSIYNLGVTEEQVRTQFGGGVAQVINGTTKIMHLPTDHATIQQADAIRKMLFAMVDDVRVILVKLADRLDRIRNIKSLEEKDQRALAKEIIDIWAPLADRLGMQTEKNEFEDLSLKYSNPDVFQQIKAIVSQKKDERDAYLQKAVQQIYKAAEKEGITVSITSRAKHFYSIYQKMRKRNKEPGELYDLLALRIICNENSECYTLVGIVHNLWKPLDGRFKDYIAMPKANGYQSLHTTVMCEGKPLEIQIRTKSMNETAEHGVASHWLYKKGTSHDLVDVENLGIFNELRKLREGHVSDENFFNELKDDLLGDEIYVFTPKGEVVKLPAGANAIDFAYHIHSAIGEKIVGAKADGKIIPLIQPLKNTQIIEILTNPQAHPTAAQLSAVKTSKAKQKIHAWLTANDPTYIDKAAVAKAEAEASANAAYSRAMQETHKHKRPAGGPPQEGLHSTGKVRIGDTTNFIVTFAQCCRPKYPDPIVGYISRNRGVTVHRADCITYQRIPNIEQRSIEVIWDTEETKGKNK
ncbi:MAG TPA: bifunctional (p)ppGpp synthetase/guanosine-3',5'-bis(diphosphate) 3'-pyrophosphohydrolase [Treponema sp.]|nr:bifunctional (p)ppGpp synthetase/guanosine-3',5'-bis(diphosphate) 3'-pyrophosphohydrolase [Treponema sp.]